MVKFVVKLKHCRIGTKNFVVVDIDSPIMVVNSKLPPLGRGPKGSPSTPQELEQGGHRPRSSSVIYFGSIPILYCYFQICNTRRYGTLRAPTSSCWPSATWRALRALWIAVFFFFLNWTTIFFIGGPPLYPPLPPPPLTPCTEYFFSSFSFLAILDFTDVKNVREGREGEGRREGDQARSFYVDVIEGQMVQITGNL